MIRGHLTLSSDSGTCDLGCTCAGDRRLPGTHGHKAVAVGGREDTKMMRTAWGEQGRELSPFRVHKEGQPTTTLAGGIMVSRYSLDSW